VFVLLHLYSILHNTMGRIKIKFLKTTCSRAVGWIALLVQWGGYGPDKEGIGSQLPAGAGNFALLKRIQPPPHSVTYPTSHAMVKVAVIGYLWNFFLSLLKRIQPPPHSVTYPTSQAMVKVAVTGYLWNFFCLFSKESNHLPTLWPNQHPRQWLNCQ